jgi:hypothetical protein
MARIFDVDPVTRTTEVFHHDPSTGEILIETRQDVTDIVAEAKSLHAMTDERAGWKGDWHRVASIPNSVMVELQNKGIFRGFHCLDPKAFKRWLNDSDNKFFRTRPGRV